MKRILKVAALAASMSAIGLAASAETVLIANDPGPNRGVRSVAVNYLSDEIAKRSGDTVKIQNNWGGALFKTTAALESLGTGVADLGVVVGAYAQSELPELNIGALVMPQAGPWVMMKSLHELFTTNETIKQRLADKNIVYINHYALPPALVGCQGKGIASAKDADGVKMSDTGGMSGLFKDLGGNMVRMPVYEVYQAMETGLIDCTVTYSYFAVATKLDELLTSVTPMDFAAVTVVITVMNKDSFDSLSAEQQAAILETGEHMADYYGEALAAADKSAMDKMTTRETPVVINAFSEEDYDAFREASKTVTGKWLADAEATGLDGQATLDEFLGLQAKWKAVAETEGLPWERN
ncbi:TRAP transporter substrate-binding protein DctP [Hoeflea prorocentri]|uniref:TRAP transporter substrate-binding protein DctP n=1 Tax=Hoeflea prorocentri TaxID=1922333 RepID=A0A9X3ZGE8_9HYPH|nr:TRAP transporter substrate-binding protein DctP [Hoeflea prorocentri]MCY6379711.1 TRAP transporter substrate-binding protein DctP [Hoeflea prorocentri]MDA5397511.1 TRAP transporter substrate-binding protein DctP [Hoeflea prorocentri]